MMKSLEIGLSFLLAAALFQGCGKRMSNTEKLNRAVGAAKSEKWEEAVKDTADVLKHDPDNISARILQALAYEKAGEKEKALDLIRQVSDGAPENFTARYTYGRLLAAEPLRQREAFTVLEEALALKTDDRDTIILLCNIGLRINHSRTDTYLKMLDQKEVLTAFRSAAQRALKEGKADTVFLIALRLDQSGLSGQESVVCYNYFLAARGNKNPNYVAFAKNRIAQLAPPPATRQPRRQTNRANGSRR